MKKHLSYIAFSFLITSNAQIGIGTDNPNATLDINAKEINGTTTNVDGIIIPRVDRARAQSMLNVTESTLIYVNDISKGEPIDQAVEIDSKGFYYYINGRWTKLSLNKNDQNFFYMPSVVLPTIASDDRITTGGPFKFTTDTFSVDLYTIFSSQFSTPVKGSVNNTGLNRFVFLDPTDYEYFVTYADESIFNTNDINITADGVLTYKVNPNAVIKNGSFMNIVLKVK
jgi:hypothetical protein